MNRRRMTRITDVTRFICFAAGFCLAAALVTGCSTAVSPVPKTLGIPVYSLTNYGAKCDGIGDIAYDDAAWTTVLGLVATTPGEIFVPSFCYTSVNRFITTSGVWVAGTGPGSSGIILSTTDPAQESVISFWGSVGGRAVGGLSPRGTWYNVDTPAAIGAMSIISSAGASHVSTGTQIEIIECDGSDCSIGMPLFVDFATVASVSGSTITFVEPLKVAFSGTHGQIQLATFVPVANGGVMNLSIITNHPAVQQVGLYNYATQNFKADNVAVSSTGDPLYAQEVDHFHVAGSTFSSTIQESELAAVVVGDISNSSFGYPVAASGSGGLLLDAGTGFLQLPNDYIAGDDIALQLTYGTHDLTVSGCTVPFTPGIGDAILLQGAYNIRVNSCSLLGGAGYGVITEDQSLTTPLYSQNNTIGPGIKLGTYGIAPYSITTTHGDTLLP